MIDSIPCNVCEIVGSIQNRHITEKGENHYCCTWEIENIFSNSYLSKKLKSPVFIVSNRSECKWYLDLFFIEKIIGNENFISCFLRLVLDRESDCEEVSAKFKLTILNDEQKHECNLDSYRTGTFKFVKKSENSSGILSSIELRHLNKRGFKYFLSIVCEIMIDTSFPEVDSISGDFGSLLKNQLFADVVLSVGEKKFPVHRVILSARSSVFAAMFAHNMIENQGVVIIKDLAEDVVEEMLRFIYTGKVEKLNDIARDLLMAADKYDLEGLRIKCEKQLIDDLSSSNVLDVIVFAKLFNATELRRKATDLFCKECAEIINTPAWKNLGQSDFELVKEIFEDFIQLMVIKK